MLCLTYQQAVYSYLFDWLAVFRHLAFGKAEHRLGHVGFLFVHLGFKRSPEAVRGDRDRGGFGVHGWVNDARASPKLRRGAQTGGAHGDEAKQRRAGGAAGVLQ